MIAQLFSASSDCLFAVHPVGALRPQAWDPIAWMLFAAQRVLLCLVFQCGLCTDGEGRAHLMFLLAAATQQDEGPRGEGHMYKTAQRTAVTNE